MSDSQKQSHAFSEKKLEYFRLRLKQKGISVPEEQTIPHRKEADPCPLSFAQQRLWFLEQFEQGTSTYNIPAALRLKGTLNLAALEQSVDGIIQRHEALRTVFANEKGRPIQIITSGQHVLNRIDLQGLSESEQEIIVRRLVDEEAKYPFDLSSGPLARWHLLMLNIEEYVLLFTMHHIISDGWSIEILIREMTRLYAAFEAGQPSPLPPLPVQYADYALWQRGWLQGAVLDQQVSYWQQRLHDLPTLALPTDHPRPAVQEHRGAGLPFSLSQTLSQQLRDLSQRQGTTLFMTLLAAFQVLLARSSGQEDIVVGTPIANRRQRELEGLIGFFVNMLVLRSDLSGNPSFEQVLERVRQVCLGAYAQQDVPFEKLVEVLQPSRDLTRHPLFQVSFQLLQSQQGPEPQLSLPQLQLVTEKIEGRVARFDLEVDLYENHQRIEGYLLYNTSLFEPANINRLLQHWHTLLEAIVAHPEQRLWQLPLLTIAEKEQLVHTWNATQVAYPLTTCLHQLVEEQAVRTPDAVAVVSEEGQLSYATLNARANQLAHSLQQRGVGPEVLVGVCLHRSLELVISLLAILKAGGAYVPLDPAYPEERLRFLMHDAQVSLVLIGDGAPSWMTIDERHGLSLEQVWSQLDEYPSSNPQSVVRLQQLAYVIYTSGSTGQPKGVQVTHRNLMHSTLARTQYYREPVKSFLLLSSFAFDSSVAGIFWTLCQGGRLILPSRDEAQDAYALSRLIVRQQVSHLLTVPSFYRLLLTQKELRQAHSLQVSIVAGEACSSALVKQHYDCLPHTTIFNEYGPTEATVWCSVHEPQNDESAAEAVVPIGRPIANTQIYLLSAALELVPIGVVGELYIGGVGVGRGYWQRPELTAERFLPDPFSDRPGARLYRTGDLARYRSDGTLEFIGRVDSQVKLRGFRIELGEIEAALRVQPGVSEAVVLLHEDRDADPHLVAYIVPAVLDQSTPSTNEFMRQSSYWQSVFEETYRSSRLSQAQNPTFDTTGWISSYTHTPLTSQEMAEWVEQAVARITALQPRRILEIGCGTGLLLFRLAPGVQAYWGTDFSAYAIQNLQSQLTEQVPPFVDLRLEQRTADNWANLPQKFFDLVILNSVVQYFPDLDYLLQVLEQAVQSLSAGGSIFVGDVRSLPLLEAFHTSVVLSQASATSSVAEVRELVRQRMQQEEELVIDPRFFDWLPQHLPQIQRVHISPRRGRAANELTQFRYDVVLEIAAPQASNIDMVGSSSNEGTNPQESMVWSEIGNLQHLTQMLESQQQVSLLHVPNRRVQSVVRACQILQAADPEQRVSDVLPEFGRPGADEQSIDPEELWALGQRFGSHVEISWSGHDKTGAYDVFFWWESIQIGQETSSARQKQRSWHVPKKAKESLSWADYATNPRQAQERRTLIPKLRQRLEEQLPGYMVPAAFVLLERLPLTPNGKLDRRALPTSPQGHPVLTKDYVAPQDSLEKLLVEVWQKVLGRERIGREDHFFELGGHSLLAIQVVAHARQAGLRLTLSSLFQYPVLADLAIVMRGESLPPLSSESSTHLGETRGIEKRTSHKHEALVGLQASGFKHPFFCIPPISGEPMCYAALAQAMGRDYPLYGLRAAGLQGEREPFTSVEEIAAYYVEAIRAHDPDGPYALGGWSFGGLVAFEMALQLQKQGARVALLALMDTFAPPFNRHKLTQEETAEISTFLAENLLQSLSSLPEQERLEPSHIESLRTLPPLEQVEYLQKLAEAAGVDEFIRVGQANFLALERYQPQGQYEGCLLLLRASTKKQQNMLDATYGWKQLTSHPIEVQVVPGTHATLINEPYVFTLAQHLQAYLDGIFHHTERGQTKRVDLKESAGFENQTDTE